MQESPEAGNLSEPGGLAATADTWLVPGISPTPALRGFPGGPGLPEPGDGDGDMAVYPAGNKAHAAAATAGSPELSCWQRAQGAWSGAGIDWVREPGWLPEHAWPDADRAYWVAGPQTRSPADTDWGHTTQPIPAIKPRPASRPRVRRPAGRVTAVAASAAVIALAAAITVTLARQPAPAPRRAGVLPGYPPARLADGALTAGAAGPRLPPALAAVAASGTTAVAAGSQVGTPGQRPVILDSTDGGISWRLASLQAPGGDVTGGAAPSLLAGGPGGWLALGRHAAWVSAAGQVWRRAPGISLQAGDRVLALARTPAGYVAVGTSGARAGLLWTSADGITWHRSTAARLGLRAGAGRVAALEQVAARGSTLVITGGVLPARSRSRAVPPPARAWRSGNGGATWTPVRVPAGHGATGLISGVAADRAGFALIRPGHTLTGRPDAVAYQSADGSSWRFSAVLAGVKNRALQLAGLSGNDSGAVLTATEKARRAPGTEVAFVTGPGRSWHRVLLLGGGAAGTLAGAAAGPGGSVIVAGSAVTPPAAATAAGSARGPFLLLAGPQYAFTGQQALARAATPGVTVAGLASGAGLEVAVGSAGGKPAIWTAAGGRWSADAPGTWAVPGLALGSVTYGNGGWLALGQVAQHGQSRLVVLASANGRDWRTVPGLGRLAAPRTVISQAAAGRAGYVLVGQHPGTGGQPAAVAWWSASPGAWSQATGTAPAAPASFPASRRAASQMLTVAAGGPGFIAAGAQGSQPAVWSSPDGRAWAGAALPVPAGARSAVLQRVAARGQRVAALGSETTTAGPEPFAAVSADGGRTWREFRLPLPACRPGSDAALTGPAGAAVTAIVAVGHGFVATGTCGAAGQQDVIVWSSADGRTWTAADPHQPGLSGPGAQQITTLTLGGTLLTGAGYTATPGGDHATLWQVRVP